MISCIACGSSRIETAFWKGPFEIRRCQACGLGCTAGHESFNAQEYYSKAYFQGGHADAYADYAGSENILRAEFRRTIQLLLGMKCRRARLLELGCAYGFLLEEARPHFETIQGIDISDDAVRFCQAKGLNTVSGVADERTLQGMYDVIVGLDVIEHVPSPQETLRELAGHTSSGAILLMTTGDWGSAVARATGPAWRLMTPPQHLWFFTETSMRLMLQTAGFRILSLAHPWKHVPFTLIAYQLQRIVGLRPRPLGLLRNMAVPVNLWDAMRVVAVRV